MSALEALKLAKETGVKVRPVETIYSYSFEGDDLRMNLPKNARSRIKTAYANLNCDELMDESGNPVEWETVE